MFGKVATLEARGPNLDKQHQSFLGFGMVWNERTEGFKDKRGSAHKDKKNSSSYHPHYIPVCFTPEYRLSTEALFPAAIYDVKAVIRWVRKNAGIYNFDPNKIAVLGFSAGGEMASFMATSLSRRRT